MTDRAKIITLVFYMTPAGNVPVLEFIRSFGNEDRRLIGSDLNLIEYRWPVGMLNVKSLKEGLYETRTSISDKRKVRVFFGIAGSEGRVVHAIIKKTQKTPKADIALARDRLGEEW